MWTKQNPFFVRNFANLSAKANRIGLDQFFPSRLSNKWAGFGLPNPLHVWQCEDQSVGIISDGATQRLFTYSGSNPLFRRVVPGIRGDSESMPIHAVETFESGEGFKYADSSWPVLDVPFLFIFIARFSALAFEKDVFLFSKKGTSPETGFQLYLDGSDTEMISRAHYSGSSVASIQSYVDYLGSWSLIAGGFNSDKKPFLCINDLPSNIGSDLANSDLSNNVIAEMISNDDPIPVQCAGIAYWEGSDADLIMSDYDNISPLLYQIGQLKGFYLDDVSRIEKISYYGDYLACFAKEQNRFGVDGLEITESIPNDILFSEDFTNAAWIDVNSLASIENTITPSGMQGAIKLIEQTAASPVVTDKFRSGFTVGVNTDLNSVVPEVGQNFILTTLQVLSGTLQAIAATDDLQPKAIGSSTGVLYVLDIVGSYGADNWVEILVINGDSGDDTNTLCVCFEDSTHLYVLRFNETYSQLFKRNGSVNWASIGSDAGGILDGSLISLERDGNDLNVYVNYEILISETDSDHTSGDPGIGMGALSVQSPYDLDDLGSQCLDYIRAGTGAYLDGCAILDTFTEAINTDLDSHTPEHGNQWTLRQQITIAEMAVDGVNDYLRPKANYINDGCLYTTELSGGIGSPDYRVECHLGSPGGTDDYFYLIARYVDNNNYYALEFNSLTAQLYKVVSGVWTTIGSPFAILNGDIIGIECENSTIRGLSNGTVKASGSDSNHTAEGKQGFGAGALRNAASDMSNVDYILSFRVIKL